MAAVAAASASFSSSCDGPSAHLVFVPCPLTGHLKPTVEIARLLVNRTNRLVITILFIDLPGDPNAAAYFRSLAAAAPPPPEGRIRFLLVPAEADSPSDRTPKHHAARIERCKPRVRAAVSELMGASDSSGSRLAGLVLDMFCTSVIDVGGELGVPCYIYYTSGAGFLGLSFHFQELSDAEGCDLTELDSDAELDSPCFANRVPVKKVLPSNMIRSKESSDSFLERARRFREVKGILVNSFMELETYALDSLLSGKGSGGGIPAVYPVGPILDLGGDGEGGDRTSVVEWLDRQPDRSVVFLCFGSKGWFGAEQLKEIAEGIERSGHRFLWSLRRQPSHEKSNFPGEYENPEEALPAGFLQRTAGRGKAIGWAPQATVLSHPAVGGFVSHCGWNSVLESAWFGVPIATWPMYAEQQANAFTVARELGLAVEITLDYRKDPGAGADDTCPVVSAEDVERGIRRVMEQDSAVRAKAEAARSASRTAVTEGGSSYEWMGRFIDDVINDQPTD